MERAPNIPSWFAVEREKRYRASEMPLISPLINIIFHVDNLFSTDPLLSASQRRTFQRREDVAESFA